MTGTASLQLSRGDAAIVPPPSKERAAAPTREAIGIVRILCILGIVYVHAWTGRTGEDLHAFDQTAQGVLRWVLIELVGRSAVPLLGAISGWLSGPSAAKRGYGGLVAVKARTILAPMLLWNLIALVLVSGFATWGNLKAPVPASIGEALDWIGCVTQPNPINVQISFLRDLFLCMCAAPLLTRLSTRWLWATWGAALIWSIVVVPWPVLLRPSILLFFVTGMLARRAGLAERIATWPLWACVAPYLLLVPVKIWLSTDAENWWLAHVEAANAIDLPMRFAAALALWRVALAIAPNAIGRLLLRGERYAFLLFCCHLVLIWLIGPLIGHAVGKLGAPGYPAYLLLQPLLALGATVLVAMALERLSRTLAGLLSGGRLSQPLPKHAASA
jgi:fucose 4-O-acetylase-like acetyltransferase